MIQHILKEIARVACTLLAVCFLINLLLNFMPGDPAAIVAGDTATPQQIEVVRKLLRLDLSLPERYVAWLADAVRGDLGISLANKPGAKVIDLILERLPVTLELTLFALTLAALVALPAGAFAALRRGSWVDHVVTGAGALALAIPGFVIAVLLVNFLAIQLPIFPSGGYTKLSESVSGWFMHLLLPALALSTISAAEISRQARGAMNDVMEESYIRTARSAGLPAWRVVVQHAGKAAAPTIVTVIGLQAATLLGGVVVLEQVFVLPGLGSLAYDAVQIRDIPLIQGIVFVGAALVLGINLLVDAALFYLVPRSR